MAYTTNTLVSLLTNLTTSDVASADITSIITNFVVPEINSELMVRVIEEKVEPIPGDSEKRNKIDSSNTTYYTRNWPLGDFDNDGDVDTSDFTVVEVNYGTDPPTRTSINVTTLSDVLRGKIVLASAPTAGRTLLISYSYCPYGLNINTPNPLLQLAATHLAAAYCFSKVNPLMLRQLNSIDVVPMPPESEEARHREAYRKLMDALKARMTSVASFKELPKFEGLVEEAAVVQTRRTELR